jgi:hypothetical protein
MGHAYRWFELGAACGLALLAACSGKATEGAAVAGAGGSDSSAGAGKPSTSSAGAPSAGGAGAPSAGGTANTAGAPSAGGTANTAGAPSAGGTANAGAPGAGAANAGGGGAPSSAGTSGDGAGGLPPLPDPTGVLKVKPSAGCGQDPMQASAAFVKYTIQTSGTKGPNAADSTTGPWSYARDYYVWLPPSYDKQKAYPLVLQGPGCGGTGLDVYSLSPSDDGVGVGVNGSVIRVGLTPPPNAIGHATNPNQSCFDDHEGDDSVEWPFYEALIDKLKSALCYDENRVFVSGNQSGAWLANELACKYAGNTAGYAIRGVASNGGGLLVDFKYLPTCTRAPLAGIWVEPSGLGSDNVPSAWSVAVNRAMQVNQCSPQPYANAMLADFPIGANRPSATCKKVLGCPAEYPLVVCVLSNNGSSDNADTVNPGFATLIQSLEAP